MLARWNKELVILISYKKDDVAKEIRSYARFFSVSPPDKANANGVLKCLSQSLLPLGITDVMDKNNVLGVNGNPILVSVGTDGASVNIVEQNWE